MACLQLLEASGRSSDMLQAILTLYRARKVGLLTWGRQHMYIVCKLLFHIDCRFKHRNAALPSSRLSLRAVHRFCKYFKTAVPCKHLTDLSTQVLR